LLFCSVYAVAALLFTPAIPHLSTFFDVTANEVQLTIYLYLLGYACGQLIYGPLSNRIGRKPAIYIGLSIAVVGALLCGLAGVSHSFALLLIARVLLALGAACGYALTFTIIHDYYDHEQARKVIPKVAVGWVVLPYLGITLGGFLVQYLGWMSTFYFLTLYVLVIF